MSSFPPSQSSKNPLPAGGGMAGVFAEQTRKRNLAIGIGAALAALIAILAFGAGRFLGLGASAPTAPLLMAQGAAPRGIMAQVASAGPPVTQQAATAPLSMPKDVEDWLKHLEKCENQKVEITLHQQAEMAQFQQMLGALGPGVGLMDPYDQSQGGDSDKSPDSMAKGKFMDLKPKWEELITFFNSYPPPPECEPIATDFNRALSEIPGMTGDLVDILNNVTANPTAALEKVQKMKTTSYGDIDRYFERADLRVADICKKYNTRKWFNVKSDIVGGGTIGKFGG